MARISGIPPSVRSANRTRCLLLQVEGLLLRICSAARSRLCGGWWCRLNHLLGWWMSHHAGALGGGTPALLDLRPQSRSSPRAPLH